MRKRDENRIPHVKLADIHYTHALVMRDGSVSTECGTAVYFHTDTLVHRKALTCPGCRRRRGLK